ncbi:hypothetical protein KAX21_05340, partial [candidate division WOR-3 bacterium]|nr:hypothetical protein [candidate division WOR-3 bacterium]
MKLDGEGKTSYLHNKAAAAKSTPNAPNIVLQIVNGFFLCSGLIARKIAPKLIITASTVAMKVNI